MGLHIAERSMFCELRLPPSRQGVWEVGLGADWAMIATWRPSYDQRLITLPSPHAVNIARLCWAFNISEDPAHPVDIGKSTETSAHFYPGD